MIENMGLRKCLANILSESAIYKIDFWLGFLPVRGSELYKVAACLRNGNVAVTIDTSQAADALYDPSTDSLLLKSGKMSDYRSLQMKSLIVHESIHALLDLNKAKDTTILSNESAAFLGQMIYRITSPGGTQLPSRIASLTIAQGKNIFEESYRLVTRYNMATRSVRIPWQLYEPLRKAIQLHPQYSGYGWKEKGPLDGISNKVI